MPQRPRRGVSVDGSHVVAGTLGQSSSGLRRTDYRGGGSSLTYTQDTYFPILRAFQRDRKEEGQRQPFIW